ncbi:DUF6241 domain-containing protein [Evansella sp. LMS18]|uniref:DUF6241 domain-containing protein n=1 Tax=Evansella sp. LMS18 TaxID=2924033 RepID=UPI0020D07ABF|nr:DUF6241 domain-containing protein [Evansella sp. LMS18]UTR10055.1 DUF6241 domain-containing protein [Evansella sp. LMS18]
MKRRFVIFGIILLIISSSLFVGTKMTGYTDRAWQAQGIYTIYDEIIYEHQNLEGKSVQVGLPDTMSESMFRKVLYYFLNSRVDAEWKWNVYEITEERTNQLLEVVENNNFNHENLYINILNDWRNSNFSNSVRYHDELRKIHGMVEKSAATGLFSGSEAEEYLEQGFPLPQHEEE